MASYTFFTNPMSRGQIVRWALHEVGADYDQVLVDWGLTFGSIPPRAAFVVYAERLQARAAYKAAKAIDHALIEESRK